MEVKLGRLFAAIRLRHVDDDSMSSIVSASKSCANIDVGSQNVNKLYSHQIRTDRSGVRKTIGELPLVIPQVMRRLAHLSLAFISPRVMSEGQLLEGLSKAEASVLRCPPWQMTALTTALRAQLSLCCPPSLAEVCELALTTKSREQNIGTRHDIDTSFRLLLTFDCLYSYNAGKSMIQALPASVCQPQANAPVGRICGDKVVDVH